MPHDLAFTVDETGEVTFVYHPNDERAVALIKLIGVTDDRRAGYVWPQGTGARTLFRALRRVFGNRGLVSDWTRSWRWCSWVVVDAETMEQLPGSYPTHDDAVDAEVRWSLAHGYPKQVIGRK